MDFRYEYLLSLVAQIAPYHPNDMNEYLCKYVPSLSVANYIAKDIQTYRRFNAFFGKHPPMARQSYQPNGIIEVKNVENVPFVSSSNKRRSDDISSNEGEKKHRVEPPVSNVLIPLQAVVQKNADKNASDEKAETFSDDNDDIHVPDSSLEYDMHLKCRKIIYDMLTNKETEGTTINDIYDGLQKEGITSISKKNLSARIGYLVAQGKLDKKLVKTTDGKEYMKYFAEKLKMNGLPK